MPLSLVLARARIYRGKTKRKARYFNLQTDEWDLQMRGSVAKETTCLSVTTDGFVTAKIVAYRRRAKS